MINLINQNLDKMTDLTLMIIISLYLRILLQSLGQTWIKTIAHTSTLMLLPILTYIITSVISGNIALSLGMVGALSIVRFRNPVRSPLELSVYFGAITIGISASVSIKWSLFLIVSVTLVAIILYAVQKITSIFSMQPFFINSFSEGNQTSVLQVSSSSEIQDLDSSNLLSSKTIDGSKINYVLASPNFDILKRLEKSLRSNELIDSLQLNR
ncbi:DUF4956 domain-containing protein [Amylibacter sp.]|nr:DUF4956 domain-containing protein [Amylibacter sp.]